MASTDIAAARKDGRSTAQKLVEATYALIVENGGCRGVNLRQIAARAGCAHSNAYNYFSSLEELLWAALYWALEIQAGRLAEEMRFEGTSENALHRFLSAQVGYAQENPELYRLFWFEPLVGEPPPRVVELLDKMRKLWIRFIEARFTLTGSKADPAWAGEIVHGYFHGEICKLVGRHAFVPAAVDDRARIVGNTIDLVDMLAVAGRGARPRPSGAS